MQEGGKERENKGGNGMRSIGEHKYRLFTGPILPAVIIDMGEHGDVKAISATNPLVRRRRLDRTVAIKRAIRRDAWDWGDAYDALRRQIDGGCADKRIGSAAEWGEITSARQLSSSKSV